MTTQRKILFLLLTFAFLSPLACHVDSGAVKAAAQERTAPKPEQPHIGTNYLSVYEISFP